MDNGQDTIESGGQVQLAESSGQETKTKVECKFDVFFSYNSKDIAFVKSVYEELRRYNVSVWLDHVEIQGGQRLNDRIEEGLEQSRCAAVFVGKDGIGDWQQMECGQLQISAIKDSDMRVIPILLPGVKNEDKIGPKWLDALHKIKFESRPCERRPIKKLYEAIKGPMPRGGYEIHVEVAENAATCLFIAPREGRPEIGAAVEAAFETLNKKPNSGITLSSAGTVGALDANHVHDEIRNAEMIIVDGSSDPQTRTRDALVLYQLGLAQSVGKPILLIADTDDPLDGILPGNHVVRYDTDQFDGEKLNQELLDQLDQIASHVRLGLVDDNLPDVSAVFSSSSDMPPMVLDKIEAVFDIGLTINDNFRDIATHIRRLEDDVKNVKNDFHDARDVSGPSAPANVAARSKFLRCLKPTYKQFLTDHERFERQILKQLADIQKRADGSFDFLKRRNMPRDMSAADASTYECIKRSANAFRSLVANLRRYQQACRNLSAEYAQLAENLDKNAGPNALEDPEGSLMDLEDRTRGLVVTATDIQGWTSDVMTHLVKMLGRRGAAVAVTKAAYSKE